MKKVFLIFLIFSAVSFAQLKLEAFTGVSFPISNKPFSNFLSINYYPGINIGAAINYNFFDIISLSPFAEYTYYFFKNNSGPFAVPQSTASSVSGSSTQFYKLGFNAKLFPHFIFLERGYILTGFTWSGVNSGSINISWYDNVNNKYVSSTQKLDDKHFLSQNFGIGIPVAKTRIFEVMLEGMISTNYSDRFLGELNLGFYF